MRPGVSNVRDDALDLLKASSTGVDIRGPQSCTQQLVSTKNVQRQIAVVVVVAMEEARFLLPMKWGVRGIPMERGALRWDSRKSVTSSSSIASEEQAILL
jgi:hypothetical protein